jgi:hypothetical protein
MFKGHGWNLEIFGFQTFFVLFDHDPTEDIKRKNIPVARSRTGSTVEALKSICQQAGAKYLGAGAIIHNRLNGQTWDGELESLAQVGRLATTEGCG